jgi:hypothetical protein
MIFSSKFCQKTIWDWWKFINKKIEFFIKNNIFNCPILGDYIWNINKNFESNFELRILVINIIKKVHSFKKIENFLLKLFMIGLFKLENFLTLEIKTQNENHNFIDIHIV